MPHSDMKKELKKSLFKEKIFEKLKLYTNSNCILWYKILF